MLIEQKYAHPHLGIVMIAWHPDGSIIWMPIRDQVWCNVDVMVQRQIKSSAMSQR